jgi:hypothetical protein
MMDGRLENGRSQKTRERKKKALLYGSLASTTNNKSLTSARRFRRRKRGKITDFEQVELAIF